MHACMYAMSHRSTPDSALHPPNPAPHTHTSIHACPKMVVDKLLSTESDLHTDWMPLGRHHIGRVKGYLCLWYVCVWCVLCACLPACLHVDTEEVNSTCVMSPYENVISVFGGRYSLSVPGFWHEHCTCLMYEIAFSNEKYDLLKLDATQTAQRAQLRDNWI